MDVSAHDLRQCTHETCAAASPPHPLRQRIGCRSLEIHSVFRQKPPEPRSDGVAEGNSAKPIQSAANAAGSVISI